VREQSSLEYEPSGRVGKRFRTFSNAAANTPKEFVRIVAHFTKSKTDVT